MFEEFPESVQGLLARAEVVMLEGAAPDTCASLPNLAFCAGALEAAMQHSGVRGVRLFDRLDVTGIRARAAAHAEWAASMERTLGEALEDPERYERLVGCATVWQKHGALYRDLQEALFDDESGERTQAEGFDVDAFAEPDAGCRLIADILGWHQRSARTLGKYARASRFYADIGQCWFLALASGLPLEPVPPARELDRAPGAVVRKLCDAFNTWVHASPPLDFVAFDFAPERRDPEIMPRSFQPAPESVEPEEEQEPKAPFSIDGAVRALGLSESARPALVDLLVNAFRAGVLLGQDVERSFPGEGRGD